MSVTPHSLSIAMVLLMLQVSETHEDDEADERQFFLDMNGF